MENTPKKVLLIGAGQLGSRHLQGLSKCTQKISIIIIDSNPIALEIAKKRFYEMPKNLLIQSVKFMNSIENYNDMIDLAIVATNADVRKNVIIELISKNRLKYLILEKVVFPSIEDFEVVMPLLKENNIKTWVNCPRRMYPFYQKLKKRTIKSTKIKIIVKGGNWGLGSNTIHMLDLLSFLTEKTNYEFNISKLDQYIYETKRKNFIEFGGEVQFFSNRGDTLQLIDDRKNDMPLKMTISFNEVKVEVDQIKGIANEYNSKIFEPKVSNRFEMPLQSELTNIQVDEILESGFSHLTQLDESYLLHKPMLNAFNSHLSVINNMQTLICPVT